LKHIRIFSHDAYRAERCMNMQVFWHNSDTLIHGLFRQAVHQLAGAPMMNFIRR
jgi:hypothetical protein